MSWLEAAVRWYVVLMAVTWAFFPAVASLCRPLADRGATLARPIALLAALYPAWLLASARVAPFSSSLVVAVVALAALLGWGPLFRRRRLVASWLRGLVLIEAGSLLLFAAYVWLRGYTPQIVGTEKPMEIAFLASSTRTAVIPPPDPWFAGEPINYYYLGYLIHGTVGRLSGIRPEIGFNLALATVFSTTAVAAFGVAWNVVATGLGRRLAAASGLFALFAIVLSGNLYAPWRLLQDPASTLSAWWWDSAVGIGWRSSRIVCDGARVGNQCPAPATETINEFPFFSFLLGDLHPHLMALPYTVVAIGLAWSLALRAGDAAGDEFGWWASVAFSGAFAGALYALNAWDLPTFLLLVSIGVWTGAGASISRGWKPVLLLTASALAAWFPFLSTYVPPTSVEALDPLPGIGSLPILSSLVSAVGPHRGERTSVVEYLTIFGLPYLFGITLIVTGAWRHRNLGRRFDLPALLIVAMATIVPGALLSAPVIPLCGIPLALAVAQLSQSKEIGPRWFALLLFAGGWALSIGVEIFYVRDAFDDRMNTLFKFYYQAWTLFALATALTVSLLWKASSAAPWPRALLSLSVVATLLSGAVYPAVASYQWTEKFAEWQGLDGIAYGENSDPDETAAIRWLGQHAAPGDVVLEAAGCSYLPFDRLPFNRVSAFTGVPAIIGWGNNHQRQWRAGQPELLREIEPRETDVAEMFADPNSPLLDEYRVTWLFVGEYESGDWRAECATAGPYDIAPRLEERTALWQESFRAGDTRIYRRSGG